jgi:hypothetical protein
VTTTGYGDLVPYSPAGKFIGAISMYLGILFLSLPISVISTKYVELSLQEHEKMARREQLFRVRRRALLYILEADRQLPLQRAFSTWLEFVREMKDQEHSAQTLVRQETGSIHRRSLVLRADDEVSTVSENSSMSGDYFGSSSRQNVVQARLSPANIKLGLGSRTHRNSLPTHLSPISIQPSSPRSLPPSSPVGPAVETHTFPTESTSALPIQVVTPMPPVHPHLERQRSDGVLRAGHDSLELKKMLIEHAKALADMRNQIQALVQSTVRQELLLSRQEASKSDSSSTTSDSGNYY